MKEGFVEIFDNIDTYLNYTHLAFSGCSTCVDLPRPVDNCANCVSPKLLKPTSNMLCANIEVSSRENSKDLFITHYLFGSFVQKLRKNQRQRLLFHILWNLSDDLCYKHLNASICSVRVITGFHWMEWREYLLIQLASQGSGSLRRNLQQGKSFPSKE